MLTVASPCAVVLATMPPLLSVIANAGRHGMLVKNAVVLEQLADIDTVALDKTGTLTVGTPHITDIVVLDNQDENAVLRLAAAAEAPSEHPLGQALTGAATSRGLNLPEATDFRAQPGRGVHALVDGRQVLVGHPVLLPDGPVSRGAHRAVALLEQGGRTAVVVVVDDRPAGVLGLSDTVRPNAAATVAELTSLTSRRPVLLTGDNPCAAEHLAGIVVHSAPVHTDCEQLFPLTVSRSTIAAQSRGSVKGKMFGRRGHRPAGHPADGSPPPTAPAGRPGDARARPPGRSPSRGLAPTGQRRSAG